MIIKRTMHTNFCRHFSVDDPAPGEIFGTPRCKAGAEFVGGGPSHTCFVQPTSVCSKREEFSAEDRAAEMKAALESEAKSDIMMRAFREAHLEPGDFKVIGCPSCGGAFNIGRAGSNGHGRAYCQGCGWGFIA